MTEQEQMEAFALALLREPDPFKAASMIFANDTNKALWVACNWPKDPEFLQIQADLGKSHNALDMLPDKVELARNVWDRMQGTNYNGTVIPVTPEEYAKLAKLYGDIMGFIEKPAAAQINNNIVIPKAIEVPVYANADEWAKEAEKSQRELLNVSRSKH